MPIRDKATAIIEAAIDSLRTTEVQLPLFGLLWIGLHRLMPDYIPPSVPIPGGDALSGFGFPAELTPGWLIICLPIIVFAKFLTPGRFPFVSGNMKKEEVDA